MIRILALSAAVLAYGAWCPASRADVLQSTGQGSAVSIVDAVAEFEDATTVGWQTLPDNRYSENGLSFSTEQPANRSPFLMTYAFDSRSWPGVKGRQLYSWNYGGSLVITTSALSVMSGLEFMVWEGMGLPTFKYSWAAFLQGKQVGSGAGVTGASTVMGFASSTGFDTLRWSAGAMNATFAPSDYLDPMIDSVRAQFVATSVPEPSALGLLATGAAMLCMARRRRALRLR